MESKRVKELIRGQGRTYFTLAQEIGITPQAVSEIVAGRTKGATARYALAAALGVPVSELWSETADAA